MTPTEPLTAERVEEIRRLAESATPGEWMCGEHTGLLIMSMIDGHLEPVEVEGFGFDTAEDRDFVVAAHPATVLALLSSHDADRAEIARLRAEVEEANEQLQDAQASADTWLAEHKMAVSRAEAEVERLRSERDQFRARLEIDQIWVTGPDGRRELIAAPEGIADGIECRDDTIRLLDGNVERLRARVERLEGAIKPFLPITIHENQDYAEVTFGDHQTQAITMCPNDWLALQDAARQALSQDVEAG